MRTGTLLAMMVLLGWMAVGPPGNKTLAQSDAPGGAASPPPALEPRAAGPASSTGDDRLSTLAAQQSQLLRELGQVKRELAALRQQLEEPGISEIFSGIGYILGLAGIGFYFHCRRQQRGA
jgi:hypothetical protein